MSVTPNREFPEKKIQSAPACFFRDRGIYYPCVRQFWTLGRGGGTCVSEKPFSGISYPHKIQPPTLFRKPETHLRFTLIELLAVIAVIATLAAMLEREDPAAGSGSNCGIGLNYRSFGLTENNDGKRCCVHASEFARCHNNSELPFKSQASNCSTTRQTSFVNTGSF